MDKQNILSLGLNSIEQTQILLNENQLSQQDKYPGQFQNKENSSNILSKLENTNFSFTSEQTLQKRVRSQIVRRQVHQTRIFQNAMCQVINQSEDQHVLISYQDQDNNNLIQSISSKKSNNQIASQQNQKAFQKGENCSQNNFSSQEGQIQQNQITQEAIQDNQLNTQQLLKAADQENTNQQKNIGRELNQIKENEIQIYDENKTIPRSFKKELNNAFKQQNISDQDNKISQDKSIPILQNTSTLEKEIQSEQNQQQLIINKNITELNKLTQSYSCQLKAMFSKIEEYQYSKFQHSDELQQSEFEIKKKWNQQFFERVNSDQVQSEIFQSQKSKIFESLSQIQFCLCRILNSNQIQDLILGFIQDESEKFEEYIFQITYNTIQPDTDSQKLILKTLGVQFENIKLEQENISILIFKKNDFLNISNKFENLLQFKSNIQQIQNYYEINSSSCQECIKCGQQEICEDQNCFKNIKSRILAFLLSKKYLNCEYSDQIVNGIIFQLSQEEFIPEYLNYVYKTIFSFLVNDQIDQQNNQQQQSIYLSENICQKQHNYSKQENIKEINNFDLVYEYQFKDYKILEKSSQNYEKSRLNPNYQMKWDIEIFKTLNNNIVSDAFLKQQSDIIQILKFKNYFLCKCFIANQNEDIFVGYQEENKQEYIDYIFVILYNPIHSEISKYNLAKQLNHFTVNGFTHILILSKDAFLQIYKKCVSNFKNEWSKDYFEQINKDKIINLQKCNNDDCTNCQNEQECEDYKNLRNFQQYKNLIFDKLIQKNYYLCEYLNKGGEGVLFQGYEYYNGQKQDFVFKILFDCNKEDIINEIKIMEMFDCHVNVIEFTDFIEIKENIHILVLEKCKFSLKDQLEELQKNNQFPLDKLLQMILSLLDGLVQFRIYNILHLDIKLSNILITNSDQYVYTDFGLSQLKKNNKKVYINGYTLSYASPEQINNDQNIDYLSDVYSLGKTFKFILNIFQKVQQQNFQNITNWLIQMVSEKMIQNEQKSRFNCLELRNEFFKFILEQNESREFLNYYVKQIIQILNTYPYDINKEIPYLFKINLCYQLNILDYLKQSIQQNIQNDTKQIQQYIAASLSDVGDCYTYLSDYKKALEYEIESLLMFQQIFKENHPSIAASLNNVGSCYQNLGDNKKALEYQLESLQMKKQIFKENHPQIASSLNNVGNCYQNLGDNKKALEYLLESLQMRKQIFKENHPQIAASLNNVGCCYGNLGDYKNALEYQLESLQMTKQIFKENHPDIAASLNNVGACYQNLGHNKKALEYSLESLKIRKQIFKENHPDIAASLNNVGNCYYNLGDYKKALEYSLESLQMRKQIFKENHPDIAASLNNVGLCYQNLGENKKALEYLLESLQMRKQIFKENHPDIAASLNNVGLCYQNLCDNKKALEYLLESLQMRKQIFKENHPDIAASLNNVGNCYQNLGDYKKALEYSLESLQMLQQIFKENHPDIAASLNNVGSCYQNLGDSKKALEYLLESLQMRKQIFKENHPSVAESLNNVGSCYQNLGDSKKALEYLLESLQMRKQIFKENHPSVAESLNNVGLCYENLGDSKKALEYLLESLQMRKQIFKENHPDIAASLNNVGCCYQNLGDSKKALEYLLESLQMRKQIFKENHSDIAASLNNVGSCYQNLDDSKKALEYQLESLQMRKQIFKENHSDIAVSLNNVGSCYQNLGDSKKALEYLLESLQMFQQIFKENHPHIAASLYNVGLCYYKLGDYKNALEFFLDSIQMQTYKENNPHFAASLNNVGLCYRNLGDKKNALEYFLESLKMFQQIFKENHPIILKYLNQVGQGYENLGDYKKALEQYLKSVQITKQIYKKNHPYISDSLCKVGHCYKNLGDYKKALQNLLESLEMKKQIFREYSPYIILNLSDIQFCYFNLGDNEMFQEYFLEFQQSMYSSIKPVFDTLINENFSE